MQDSNLPNIRDKIKRQIGNVVIGIICVVCFLLMAVALLGGLGAFEK